MLDERAVQRGFVPRLPVTKPLFEPPWHRSLGEGFPVSIPVATDDPAPLRIRGDGLEQTAPDPVGIDFDQPERVGIGVPARRDPPANPVDPSTPAKRHPVTNWLCESVSHGEHEPSADTSPVRWLVP